MAYPDSQFNTPVQIDAVGSPAAAVSLSTSTASGTNTFAATAGTALAGTMVLPKFVNPTKITGIRVYCVTAPASNLTGVNMYFLNGTSTFGSATNIGAAANATVDATLSTNTVGSNGATTNSAWFTTTNGQASMTVITTATASGQTQGSYAIDFVTQGLFTT